MFLEGFRQFIIAAKLSPKQTRVVFYGLDFYHDNKERLLIFNAELLPYLRTTHRLAYNDLLDRLKDASLLLLLSSKGANWLNAKIFDYLPLKRKVILVSTDHGILESIMNECNAGEIYDSVAQAKAAFIRLYREFEQNKKTIQQTTGYEKYSREHPAKVMIDNILSCVA
jgi:hypothetical protein